MAAKWKLKTNSAPNHRIKEDTITQLIFDFFLCVCLFVLVVVGHLIVCKICSRNFFLKYELRQELALSGNSSCLLVKLLGPLWSICGLWSLATIQLKWVDFQSRLRSLRPENGLLGLKALMFAGDQTVIAPTHFMHRNLGCLQWRPWHAMNETVQK